MSEKDLGSSVDVEEGSDSRGYRRRTSGRFGLRVRHEAFSLDCNGLSGMSSLLFACDTSDAMGHV